MRKAGGYPTRFEWLQRQLGAADAFGQKAGSLKSRAAQPGYPSQGFAWGVVENPAGNRSTEKESERQETTATVRLRGFPAVAAGDQLREVGLGYVWTVLSVVRSQADNEVVCEVWR